MTFLDKALYYINFQINKHGQYNGMTEVEDVVNCMTPYQLLELIADAIDNPPDA